MKKIVAFGDSFVWGDELVDPALGPEGMPFLVENKQYREQHCFTGQLAEHYGVSSENFGIPGGSLQSTVWTYLWWLDNEQLPVEDCLVLVGLTETSRQTFYNPRHQVFSNDAPWNRFVHSAWVHNSRAAGDWGDLVRLHTTLTDCEQSRALSLRQTQLLFDRATHPVVQFFTLRVEPTPYAYSTQTDDEISLKDLAGTDLKPHGHPNEKGHTSIKEHLQKRIDTVIL